MPDTMFESVMSPVRPLGRKVLSLIRGRRDLDVAPFDELFPHVEKHLLYPSQQLETKELPQTEIVPGIAHYAQSTFLTPPVFAAILRDVLYCPVNNVVLTNDGRILADSISSIRELDYLDTYALSARRITHLKGPATALRSRFNHYYHMLVDNAPRLFLTTHEAVRELGPIDVLLRDGPTPLENFLLSRLAPAHLRVRPLKRRRLYRIDNFLFLSFLTRRHAGFLPKPYRRYVQRRMLPQRPRTRKHRIYISRAGNSKGRCVINEEEVMDSLRPLGFERYQLETLSFSDQIDLFYDAEAVVGPHGAGFANLVYAEGATVIEWFPSRHFVPSFYFLSKAYNHTYAHHHSDGTWRDDDLTVNVPELHDALQTHGIC